MTGGRAFRAGVLGCVAASDGELPYPPTMLFANAEADELARAADDQRLVAACHLGRHGRLEREGGAFRLVAESA
jgi:hypothetical protein